MLGNLLRWAHGQEHGQVAYVAIAIVVLIVIVLVIVFTTASGGDGGSGYSSLDLVHEVFVRTPTSS